MYVKVKFSNVLKQKEEKKPFEAFNIFNIQYLTIHYFTLESNME